MSVSKKGRAPLSPPPPSGVPEYDNSVAVGDIFAWKFSIFSHMSQMNEMKIMWKFFLKEASILLNQEKYFLNNNNWLQAKYRHEEILKIYVLCSNGQIYGGYFTNFCALLRIYELYLNKVFSIFPAYGLNPKEEIRQ